ncbi:MULTISPECIES: helix-turn-helix domain-containing protein [Okeania]|uniref:Helix-turn-helix domain-containing protein n=1 Tax=Okeania hirsuta TaxID=1458930 RepID=A0A3N6NX52_9CYAN|nr:MULTISPECIES: helix-turn-helix domain-containing protein [Okeania]NET13516.1 helix-turn-helix domain-containing protein [Okeania sp. SIO1H6]NES77698.1 helix-turn-helix domain-containing protein [Okeania sp. SIO1H4]NES89544.1 helix-turn-helix domain-containing protein [Okeania sp. SIO2B9]NET21379.1 helix-turn-helix domain-containing protein [Okeania sp. SIO1H5]NET78015.1 helix-turn-helix domain-containing protein [Okeania sp. SIO1F9]
MKTKTQILETESELKKLLSQETDGHIKEKLQALYWLKTKKLYTIGEIAELLGCHRVTVQRWFGEYRRKDSGESDRLTGLEW